MTITYLLGHYQLDTEHLTDMLFSASIAKPFIDLLFMRREVNLLEIYPHIEISVNALLWHMLLKIFETRNDVVYIDYGCHIPEFELTDAELHLYSRQILLDGWDIEAQEKLKFSNICIVGCGGIGCALTELLARAGVGKITLIDPDTIEMSNLQRQLAFTPNDLGFIRQKYSRKGWLRLIRMFRLNILIRL